MRKVIVKCLHSAIPQGISALYLIGDAHQLLSIASSSLPAILFVKRGLFGINRQPCSTLCGIAQAAWSAASFKQPLGKADLTKELLLSSVQLGKHCDGLQAFLIDCHSVSLGCGELLQEL